MKALKSAIRSIENSVQATQSLGELVEASFQKIAPFWPLENLIAVNPLQGFEEKSFEEAMYEAHKYFQQGDLPEPLEAINRETIKWLQAYLDEGISIFPMPLRQNGLYKAWRMLAPYDRNLTKGDAMQIKFLKSLPRTPKQAIASVLIQMGIPKESRDKFLTLLLTTLPGWASYIKCLADWTNSKNKFKKITKEDYLAVRAIITSIYWPQAKELLNWYDTPPISAGQLATYLEEMRQQEKAFRIPLLQTIAQQPIVEKAVPAAQLVFCIDVRSEPFRRALESLGDYQTYGFAGFFGLPVQVADAVSGESYSSCPVLLAPRHTVYESPCSVQALETRRAGFQRLVGIKQLYHSLKYAFTTPFILAEGIGAFSGLWMGLRSLSPRFSVSVKNAFLQLMNKPCAVQPYLDDIKFEDQCSYAESALKMMGLTSQFAPLVVLCGHGSTTENNPYASALDCGACGGRHGASNARILAAILNQPPVRDRLGMKGLVIPQETVFIAAQHDTTTDKVTLYTDLNDSRIGKLEKDLALARRLNATYRLKLMGGSESSRSISGVLRRSRDWAETRPEWGLARNCCFIVGPRDLTKSLQLDGRCFLHSYDFLIDQDGQLLLTILTAPMVVAQWINTQYLFSTYDNVAYGSGSKITHNVVGKIGIMQGNASDLMTGLPLQSVNQTDRQCYHQQQRLMTVVYAPREKLDSIIRNQSVLKKLFGNGWVQLACIEPETRKILLLQRDLTWGEIL